MPVSISLVLCLIVLVVAGQLPCCLSSSSAGNLVVASSTNSSCGGRIEHDAAWQNTSCTALNYTLTIASQPFLSNRRKVGIEFGAAVPFCFDETTGAACAPDRQPSPRAVKLQVTGKGVNATLTEGTNRSGLHFHVGYKYLLHVQFPVPAQGTRLLWSGELFVRYQTDTPVWVVVLFITLGVLVLAFFIALGVCFWETRRPMEHGYESIA